MVNRLGNCCESIRRESDLSVRSVSECEVIFESWVNDPTEDFKMFLEFPRSMLALVDGMNEDVESEKEALLMEDVLKLFLLLATSSILVFEDLEGVDLRAILDET